MQLLLLLVIAMPGAVRQKQERQFRGQRKNLLFRPLLALVQVFAPPMRTTPLRAECLLRLEKKLFLAQNEKVGLQKARQVFPKDLREIGSLPSKKETLPLNQQEREILRPR